MFLDNSLACFDWFRSRCRLCDMYESLAPLTLVCTGALASWLVTRYGADSGQAVVVADVYFAFEAFVAGLTAERYEWLGKLF